MTDKEIEDVSNDLDLDQVFQEVLQANLSQFQLALIAKIKKEKSNGNQD